MLIKIFGRGTLPGCLRLCRRVEEAVSQNRGDSALSMTFLDLDHRAAQRQASRHHVGERVPVLVATREDGEEVARCRPEGSVEAFLEQLLT